MPVRTSHTDETMLARFSRTLNRFAKRITLRTFSITSTQWRTSEADSNMMSDTVAARMATHRESLQSHEHGGLDDLHTELDKSPIHEAARENDLDELKRILACEGHEQIHTLDKYGLTALHWAADRGHAQVARYLLEVGADPNAIEKRLFRRTPLHFAAISPSAETVRVLLAHGAAADALEYRGWSTVHYAAYAGALDILRELADHGDCDLLGETKAGETALQIAVSRGHDSTVEFLRSLLGANTNVQGDGAKAKTSTGDVASAPAS